MKGFLVIFFTQQNRRHRGKMLGDWLVDLAKEMGLRGATLATGIEGFGHSGKLHSSHFLSWPISLPKSAWQLPKRSSFACLSDSRPKISPCFT